MNPLWLVPPHVAIAVLIISLGLDTLLPTPPDWNFRSPLLGFTLLGLGSVVIVWTLGLFCKWATSPSPAKKASTLVTEGPFRISRNPIYLGGISMLSGCALVWGSIAALVMPLIFFLAMNFVYIPFEEQRLLDAFGNAYVAYKSRVRRWL
ncbi:MAG: isoprenylcysteine carboxylmethyltransferase family protein [Bdellovibrionales bacterium]